MWCYNLQQCFQRFHCWVPHLFIQDIVSSPNPLKNPRRANLKHKKVCIDLDEEIWTIVCLVSQPAQHVIHHHISTCSVKTCPGYCELCYPWIEQPVDRRPRSPSPSPPTHDQERYSRREEFDRSKYAEKLESIEEKIERIRQELHSKSFSNHDKSTETIDYYRPPPTPPPEPRIPYKIHYDAPKPRSRSRPRSTSSHRSITPSKKKIHVSIVSLQSILITTWTMAFIESEWLSLAWFASSCLSWSNISSFTNIAWWLSYMERNCSSS